ncbi:MAG: GNAT family N-acetyltransferase [Bacteroides sp.]|nr:GNAT family N-acetyltransferase [Bacteroides sp.]
MIKFIGLENSLEWDDLVNSLPSHDVYYLSGYVKAFKEHGDGQPVLIWWEADNMKAACVIMLRDIANDKRFSSLKPAKYFDAVTPYGYGGFIFSSDPSEMQLAQLKNEFNGILKEWNIISVFFRFHPVLDNAKFSSGICDVIDLGRTISMDLESPERIWANLSSKNRNLVRKAEKNDVRIYNDTGLGILRIFKDIYDGTMTADHASNYYFFNDKFYESIDTDLKDNYKVFYAMVGEKIVSASIILFDNKQVHYHLSGSLPQYRSLAPSNLLLYKVALWGSENGYRTFHLGGGIGSAEDALYKFKAAFNRNSDDKFSIGKLIVNQEAYSELVNIRCNDKEFDINSNFFPLYRS